MHAIYNALSDDDDAFISFVERVAKLSHQTGCYARSVAITSHRRHNPISFHNFLSFYHGRGFYRLELVLATTGNDDIVNLEDHPAQLCREQ